ncbi:MAG: ATP-binding cassette domain-containing protein [Acidobacteriota bacterium]
MTPSEDRVLISAERLNKRFATVQAVRDLSFTIARGEIFALLGPNGAGKTTLVRMLVGILKPDSGTIRFGDEADAGSGDGSSPPASLKLGYLPEERGLYADQPVLRTLEYFGVLYGMSRPEARDTSAAWLDRFGLADRSGEKLEALSKGNQQKVQFISAVLHRPRLAILDEPFSGLDPLNQELFLEIIGELSRQGTTIVLSAHQMNLVEQVADHILLIDQGSEVLRGTMAEIRARAASRDKIIFSLEGEHDLASLADHPALRKLERKPGGEVVAWLRPDARLADAVAAISAELPLASINSARVSLHEIFIDSVGRRGGAES